jgi:hypothetical protein
MKEQWQVQMDAAFDRYFEMSAVLKNDLASILDSDDGSQSFRRNFVRAACALSEGHLSCFRGICAIGLETGPGDLTADEVKALQDERAMTASDRTKFTLRATYKMLKLPDSPSFSDSGWASAQLLLTKRDVLMHPKCMSHLLVADGEWGKIKEGTQWLFAKLFGVVIQLARVHSA